MPPIPDARQGLPRRAIRLPPARARQLAAVQAAPLVMADAPRGPPRRCTEPRAAAYDPRPTMPRPDGGAADRQHPARPPSPSHPPAGGHGATRTKPRAATCDRRPQRLPARRTGPIGPHRRQGDPQRPTVAEPAPGHPGPQGYQGPGGTGLGPRPLPAVLASPSHPGSAALGRRRQEPGGSHADEVHLRPPPGNRAGGPESGPPGSSTPSPLPRAGRAERAGRGATRCGGSRAGRGGGAGPPGGRRTCRRRGGRTRAEGSARRSPRR